MRILAIACVVVHIASARVASAENVVVAGRDAALVAALGDALAPQQVIAVEDSAPTSVGALTGASRQLVARENAAAAIWLIHDGTITTLVAYDRDADRVLVRTVPYTPPLDDAQAAVTARSARAMLRALAVDEESSPQPAPIAVVVKPQTEPATPQLATMAGLGARFGSPGTTSSALLTLAVIWRPRTFGIALDVAMGLAPDISGTNFEGSIGDRSIAAVARLPLAVAPAITIALSGGVAVHALRFAGETPMRTIVDWKFDPAARLGATASYAFRDGVEIGLAVSADYLLRRHRYEVEGEEILVMTPFQLMSAISLTIQVL